MTAKIALLSCLGLLFTLALAAEAPDYRYSRPIVRQDGGKQTLLAVPLDSEIYAASQDGFNDLRLLDQDGAETPYLLQKIATRKTVSQRLPSRNETQALQKTGDDGIVITVRLEKDAANADGLTVATTQHNFEYSLQIQGSTDGNDWHVLVENAAIYDYSRFMAVGNRDIALPANSYRYFKLTVAKATQTRAAELLEQTRTMSGGEELQRNEKLELLNEPLHIEHIDFWHNQSETLPETEQQFAYPVAAFKISQDAEHKTSLIDIDSQRQPLTGFKLQINTANFNRDIEVQIPRHRGIETQMQTIGNTVLQALHFQDINRESSGITFPEQRQAHYRIVIRNQDNPPLDIAAVAGVGYGYQLLFLPQPDKIYRLRYGADKAEFPRYDTAPIQELLRRGYQTTAAALGGETAAAPSESKLDIGKLLNTNLFLGLVIALMVAVLAWCLYRVGRRVLDTPEQD